MALDTLLWREASLAIDVDSFLARVGDSVLDAVDASMVIVRALDREQQHLVTLASIRRGAVGVARPARPRTELTSAASGRIASWIEAGESERTSARNASMVSRDLLRGIAETDGEWWLVPIVAGSDALGVLLVNHRAGKQLESRRLAAISEPIAAVLATEQAKRELQQLREAAVADKDAALARLQVRDIGASIVGADAGLSDVMRQVEQVAPTSAPVLILGETGSGKEVVARAIHERSARASGPVLRVNCGAISPELIDSELFGHERGSFTGAAAQRRGWFERADGGTLFLDEIGELPLAAQVRLLRVLQDGVFERVGGARALEVDVRVIAATHRDLAAMVRAGQFREDLWYRINVFVIPLPPLRERQGDIPALVEHFAHGAGRRFGAGPLIPTAADIALLQAYDWPGNVRELSAVIERAAILGEGRRLDVERALGIRGNDEPARDPNHFPTLEDAMRTHIERALLRSKGQIEGPQGAAMLLDIHPNTLRSRMTKLGLRWERFR
ncbi:MAG: GAF/sigma-54-interact/HTH domain transcription regulator [Myxococcales bacterium]|nr:GAF/sigma-54-interact/HTH domain transcription regulator [Myxococcales bacterium]